MKNTQEYNRTSLIDSLIIQMMCALSDIQENELSDGSQFSNKIYNWIEDDILAVKIHYLGDLSDDSTRAEEIELQAGKLTQSEALELLTTRIVNTIQQP
jgi:hypothetical protein